MFLSLNATVTHTARLLSILGQVLDGKFEGEGDLQLQPDFVDFQRAVSLRSILYY